MTIVQRGKELYALNDDIQVAAFLSRGWSIYRPTVVEEKKAVDETVDKVVDEPVDKPEIVKSDVDELENKSIKELRAIAKEKGINSFGKNAETLREEIRNL